MTLLGLIIWLVIGAPLYAAARSEIPASRRYRTGAAIAIGVLWPALAMLIFAFLAIDLIEWCLRPTRDAL